MSRCLIDSPASQTMLIRYGLCLSLAAVVAVTGVACGDDSSDSGNDTPDSSVDPPDPTPDAGSQPDAGVVTANPDRPFQDEIIYFVMTDRFFNGDQSNDQGAATGLSFGGFDPSDKRYFHGGDLAGLTEKLDYIAGLGATALWLTPVVTNRAVQGSSAGYHGYWGVDFFNVDPHLGTNQDFADLVEAAHERGMKVFLDIVLNHTADVIRFQECGACAYRDTSQTGYTPVLDPPVQNIKNPAWMNNTAYYHNRGDSTFSGESSLLGDFFGLDDLATDNQVVIDGLIAIYTHWIETYRVDGFRIDTFKHAHPALWRQFLPAMEAAARARGIEHFTMFPEIFESLAPSIAGYTRTTGARSALDFVMRGRVEGVFGHSAATDSLRDLFADDDFYASPTMDPHDLASFIGSHDEGRFARHLTRSAPDDEKVARVKLAHAFMMFARGVPVIYYGAEQGFVGDGGDSDARQDMMPSLVASYNDDDLIGTDRTTASSNFDTAHPIYQAIAEYAAIYQAHDALRRGRQLTRFSASTAGLFAFSRVMADDRIEHLVVFNNATGPSSATFATGTADGSFTALYPAGAGALTSDASGQISVTVPGLSFAIYRADAAMTPAAGALSVTITGPRENSVLRNLAEVTADVSAGSFARVDFAVSVDGGAFESIGADWTAPYRVFWDLSPFTDARDVTIRATVDDLRGTTESDTRVVRVDPRVPSQLTVHYENGNSRTHAVAVTDNGAMRGPFPVTGGVVSIPVAENDGAYLVIFESRSGESFRFDRPLHVTSEQLSSFFAAGPQDSLIYEIFVNNDREVAGANNFLGSGAPPALPANPAAPAPFGATVMHARGSMNGWSTDHAMSYEGNYTYKTTIPLSGDSIDHKFADATWKVQNFGGPYTATGSTRGGGSSNLSFSPAAAGDHDFYFFAIPDGGTTYHFHRVVPSD